MKREAPLHALAAGFRDPVHDAQRVFRTLLAAMAHPARWCDVHDALIDAGDWHQPTPRSLVAALLTLCDHDTAVWFAPAHRGLATWLRFHTGAPMVEDPAHASLAICDAAELPVLLPALARGTAEYPDRSASAWVVSADQTPGAAMTVVGPGIAAPLDVHIPGLTEATWQQRARVNGDFPLGVDVMVFNAHRVLGLPRTTRAHATAREE